MLNMNESTRQQIKKAFLPAYHLYKKKQICRIMKAPVTLADNLYYSKFKTHINWKNPENLNEKINWLKFHVDPKEWALLADKLEVRKYVASRGLSHILVKLIGSYNSASSLLKDWEKFPNEFIIKSNNGCGNAIIISNDNGGKASINLKSLAMELDGWQLENTYGLSDAEFHYLYIKNRIIVEELLSDYTIRDFSRSLIDYKIWCFNGAPFGCFVAYDRIIGTSHHFFDYYDLDWHNHPEVMTDKTNKQIIPKPENWEKMLEYASILSKGHPQVRVDLYNIDGKIYFGELTFTSLGGYMDYFENEFLMEMGRKVDLVLTDPINELVPQSEIHYFM